MTELQTHITPENLRARRKALGLTQDDLARLFGLSRATINRMEKGSNPDGVPLWVGSALDGLNSKMIRDSIMFTLDNLKDLREIVHLIKDGKLSSHQRDAGDATLQDTTDKTLQQMLNQIEQHMRNIESYRKHLNIPPAD